MSDETVIKYILTAMKVTKADVKPDFADTISDVCFNGLPQAVWARRAQVLSNEVAKSDVYELLHIKRGFWEITPVYNVNSGELYLLTSKDNFDRVKKQFKKQGDSSHYTYDLLLYNSNLLPKNSNMSLFDVDNRDVKHRFLENQKMLGYYAENVKKVYIVVVDYVANKAIEAEILLLNEKYELVSKRDLTSLLHESIESLPEFDQVNNNIGNPSAPMVTLKKKQTRKSD